MNCYHCQSNVNDYDIFCHNCGKELNNKCSNNGCNYSNITLKQTDQYCRLCGSHTTFKEKGYIGVEHDKPTSNAPSQRKLRKPTSNVPVPFKPTFDAPAPLIPIDDDDIPF